MKVYCPEDKETFADDVDYQTRAPGQLIEQASDFWIG